MAIPFDNYWDAIKPEPHFESRKEAARIAWETNPDKQRPIMAWLQQHGAYPDRNPYFFIVDFQLRNHLGEPEWKTGGETGEDLVQVKYNGQFKICTRATMELFGLQWVRDW